MLEPKSRPRRPTASHKNSRTSRWSSSGALRPTTASLRTNERHTAVSGQLAQDPRPGTVGVYATVTPANHARGCRRVRNRSYGLLYLLTPRHTAQAAKSAPRHLTGLATTALTRCTPRVCLPKFAASARAPHRPEGATSKRGQPRAPAHGRQAASSSPLHGSCRRRACADTERAREYRGGSGC